MGPREKARWEQGTGRNGLVGYKMWGAQGTSAGSLQGSLGTACLLSPLMSAPLFGLCSPPLETISWGLGAQPIISAAKVPSPAKVLPPHPPAREHSCQVPPTPSPAAPLPHLLAGSGPGWGGSEAHRLRR